jgi:hypothetical protein
MDPDELSNSVGAAVMNTAEIPIAYRLWWLLANPKPFDELFRPAPRYNDFSTQAEAETRKRLLVEQFGDQVCAHVERRYLSKAKRERSRKARQQSLDQAGWPILRRSPQIGVPETKRCRRP